jgi:polysaccharide biosynthesis protein PslH
MQKVLFITKFIPAPAFNGGTKRSLAWLHFLSRYYEVTLVGHWDKNYGDRRKAELRNSTAAIYGYPCKRTLKSFLCTAARAVLGGRSVTLLQYHHLAMQRKIDALCASQAYAFILCEELSSMQYVGQIRNIPILFDDQNIEYELTWRRARYARPYLRFAYFYEANRIRHFEQVCWKRAAKTYFVSERDRDICTRAFPATHCEVLNNTFSQEGITVLPPAEWFARPTVAFAGNISWAPNHSGLLCFITKVYPYVKQALPEVKFYIMGSTATKDIVQLCAAQDIELLENVDEAEKSMVLSKCWVGVAPVYYGSGTRVKLLEYWAHAKATVSTKIGAEGLAPSEGAWVADDPLRMAEMLIALLRDREKSDFMGNQNRAVFMKLYEESAVYADSLYRSITTQRAESITD